jgi:YVTN family beta-propeller protein
LHDSKVYCASEDGDLTVIDGPTDSVRETVSLGHAGRDLCYDPAGNKVYCATGSEGGDVIVFDGGADTVLTSVEAGAAVRALCLNTRSNKVYAATGFGTVAVIDAAADTVLATVVVGREPRALCYDSLDNVVCCANAGSGDVTVIDGATNRVIAAVGIGVEPHGMVWNPVQNRVYVANHRSSSISVLWDSIAAVQESLRPRVTIVRSVIFLPRLPPDARYVLFASDGRKALDLRSGACDVSRLPAGVYFVSDSVTAVTGRRAVRKVVLVR